MDIKYYDLLSTTIIGIVIVAICKYLFFENIKVDSVVYVSFGYLAGYFVNAIGSLLENFFYKTIRGKPSDKLLTLIPDQDWTGCERVKFYEAKRVIERLKIELKDPNASTYKMFSCAMRKVNACEDCRVPTFNAQYAWSRTVLTTVLIAVVLSAFRFYNNGIFWLIAVPLLFISWNRFREKGYYYAREVLNEYLTRTDQKDHWHMNGKN